MKFMLWSMMRKNEAGEVIKQFEPKHLSNIAEAAKKEDIDSLLLYEVPLKPTDNKWNYLRDALHGSGWNGFVRAAYHYDWGMVYLSKMEVEKLEVVRFNDADDTRDFDFVDPTGRIAISIFHERDHNGFSLVPDVTFFHASPQQNSAIRCETIDTIVKNTQAGLDRSAIGCPHILAGNLIDNETKGQVFQKVLKPLGYAAASDMLTLPATNPKHKADCIFIQDLTVKSDYITEDFMRGNSLEHLPLIVELA